MPRHELPFIECPVLVSDEQRASKPPRLTVGEKKTSRALVFSCGYFKDGNTGMCSITGEYCILVKAFIDAQAVKKCEISFRRRR